MVSSHSNNRTSLRLLWLPVGMGLSLNGIASDPSDWACGFCPEPTQGTSIEIEAGTGYVDGMPLQFSAGEGIGLQEHGFAWVSPQLQASGERGRYFQLQGLRLGLVNPSLEIQAGEQGRYGLQLNYQELRDPSVTRASTPFLVGNGGTSLTLPADWVFASQTGDMSSLNDDLRQRNSEVQRRRLGFSGQAFSSSHWNHQLKFHREERQGRDYISGSFLTQSAWLPQPIDYVTDRIELSSEYLRDTWSAELAYQASLFRNDDKALSWDNPYISLTGSPDRGELALAPDNQAHFLSLSARYFGSSQIRLSTQATVGRLTQDEALRDASINPLLNSQAVLPRDSAQARVDTLHAHFRGQYRPYRQLNFRLHYRIEERDNKTPQDEFVQVQTDTFVALSRQNLTYSYSDRELQLQGDYRATRQIRLRFGGSQNRRQRDGQARRDTTEDALFADIKLRESAAANLSARFGYSERDGSQVRACRDFARPGKPKTARIQSGRPATQRSPAALPTRRNGSAAVQLASAFYGRRLCAV